MPAPANLVHQTSTGAGTADFSLTAVNGKQTFSDAFSSSPFWAFVSNRDAAGEWEVLNTSLASGLLDRSGATVVASSNVVSGVPQLVNFSAGTKDVTNDIPAGFQFYGTAGTTDNRIPRADGTGGQQLQASGVEIDDSDNVNITTSGKFKENSVNVSPIGKQTIWIPAAAMIPRATNGAAVGNIEMSTNKNMVRTLDFDTSTQEFAQFSIAMPKGWNEGTVSFQPIWSHPSTTTNFGVVWALQAVARSDDDPLDVAFGTEQTSTDTGGTTNDLYIGPESSAITIDGSPAELDVVQFQIKRNVSDGSDTMAVDARLHGIRLFYTTNAATDA